MRLSTREDIEAPLDFVFRMLVDTDHWERAALRRGIEVVRQDRLEQPGPGMEWKVSFGFRDTIRRVTLRVTQLETQQRLVLGAQGESLEASCAFEVAEMGPRRTRLAASFEMKPQTLTARLFVQSLRLAKGRVTRRFEERLAQLSVDIEQRYRQSLSV